MKISFLIKILIKIADCSSHILQHVPCKIKGEIIKSSTNQTFENSYGLLFLFTYKNPPTHLQDKIKHSNAYL
jgi:hypothetical protein